MTAPAPATDTSIGTREAGNLIQGLIDGGLDLDTGIVTPPEVTPPDDEVPPDQETPPSEEVETEIAPPEETPDPEDEEGEDTPEIPDNAVTTVKVDGKTIKVTAKELRDGYSRTQDYTAKTQAVAEQRRAVEAERVQTLAEREELQRAITQVRTNLEAAAPKRPDIALFQTDPMEFSYQEALYNRHQEEVQRIAAAQTELNQRTAADHAALSASQLREEATKLLSKVPTWKDEQVAKKEQTAILAYGQREGYTPAELAQVTDHRAVAVLRKAMRYDELMAKTPKPVPAPKAAPTPTLTPGKGVSSQPASPSTRTQKAVQRAAETGRVEDAASAIKRLGLG